MGDFFIGIAVIAMFAVSGCVFWLLFTLVRHRHGTWKSAMKRPLIGMGGSFLVMLVAMIIGGALTPTTGKNSKQSADHVTTTSSTKLTAQEKAARAESKSLASKEGKQQASSESLSSKRSKLENELAARESSEKAAAKAESKKQAAASSSAAAQSSSVAAAAESSKAAAAAESSKQAAAASSQRAAQAAAAASQSKAAAANTNQGGGGNNQGDMNTGNQGTIVGNVNSKIYHVPGQAGYRMNSSNAVYFKTEQDAINAGYRKALR